MRRPTPGWSEFLGLLRKYRERRPINGVIVTVNAQELLEEESARERTSRRRAAVSTSWWELQIQLPVT